MKSNEKRAALRLSAEYHSVKRDKNRPVQLVLIAAASSVVALSGIWLGPAPLGIVLGIYALFMIWAIRSLRVRDTQPTATRTFWRDVVPCYLSVQDKDLKIIETNAAFRRDFGDHMGEHCYQAYKRRDSACPECPVLRTFKDGTSHTSEETALTKAGETAEVLVTSAPIFDEADNTVVAVMEMSTNVTELKTLHRELERRREHFKRLFDIVPCYISVQDREYRIVESNRLLKKDFGECDDRHCYRIYKDQDSICPDCPVEKTFADGQVHTSEELVTTREGRRTNMMVYSMPIEDENGDITAVMEVGANITEVKQLERQLVMVGLAVTGMAHRIKNILMGLEGGIFVAKTGLEENDQETTDQGWDMVERNVARISRVAKDLLFCSKEREPELQDNVCPQDIVREVFELYQPRASKEGIELRVDLSEEKQSGVFDPEGLHKLIANLTANALDACRFDPGIEHKQHRITLRCMSEGADTTIIEVADNGAGIPEEYRDTVFRGFFSTKGTEGTGLGLLSAQKVAREHGGDITFVSEEGKGTTFTVNLPLRTGAAEVVAGQAVLG